MDWLSFGNAVLRSSASCAHMTWDFERTLASSSSTFAFAVRVSEPAWCRLLKKLFGAEVSEFASLMCGTIRNPSIDRWAGCHQMSSSLDDDCSLWIEGRKQIHSGDAFLLPFKHEDGRITLADRPHGPGQGLEVRGKLSPFGPSGFAIYLVGD